MGDIQNVNNPSTGFLGGIFTLTNGKTTLLIGAAAITTLAAAIAAATFAQYFVAAGCAIVGTGFAVKVIYDAADYAGINAAVERFLIDLFTAKTPHKISHVTASSKLESTFDREEAVLSIDSEILEIQRARTYKDAFRLSKAIANLIKLCLKESQALKILESKDKAFTKELLLKEPRLLAVCANEDLLLEICEENEDNLHHLSSQMKVAVWKKLQVIIYSKDLAHFRLYFKTQQMFGKDIDVSFCIEVCQKNPLAFDSIPNEQENVKQAVLRAIPELQ